MHALVTGGGGFIGSHLCDWLAQNGHLVTVLLRPGESPRNLNCSQTTITPCDVLDRVGLERLMPDVDVVYHLAARTDLNGGSPDDYRVNTEGTSNVLERAASRGVKRFVLYSSMLAVALTRTAEPTDETFDAPNHTAYGRSKREAERIVAQGNVPWTIIRPTLVFGPRERSTMRAYIQAIQSGRFCLIGPDVLQSFVYVKNLVQGTYQASLSEAAVGQTFFLSDPRPYTLAEFSRAAAQSLGVRLPRIRLPIPAAMGIAWGFWCLGKLLRVPVPIFPSRVRTMTTPYVYSIEKARRVFGYNPPFSLDQAWQETAAWYREHLHGK